MKERFIITGQRGELGSELTRLFRVAGLPFLSFEEFNASDVSGEGARVLHLAARANEADPERLLDANVDYLREVVATCRRRGVPEFVFFSSVSVYGKADQEDLAEDAVLAAPGLYGVSKLLGERYLAGCGMKVLCLRLPGVLEPTRATNLLGRVRERLAAGTDVELTNGRRLFNNFISVADIFTFVTETELPRPLDAVNLAVEKRRTLYELVHHMGDRLGSSARILFRDGDAPFFNLSVAKAAEQYGYVPSDPIATIDGWLAQRGRRDGRILKEQSDE